MPITVQEYLAKLAQKAAADLETIILSIPEDKRTWSPGEKARTALDQVAEVALLNGTTAEIIKTQTWPAGYSFDDHFANQAVLAQDCDKALALLKENTVKVVEAIRNAPDDILDSSVQMPWGPMTVAQIIAYPYWNMTYHEGQINYIAAMLGCQP